MIRLSVGFACLILAALFAALAWVLARPKWRWEQRGDRLGAWLADVERRTAERRNVSDYPTWTTSPWSVTSRAGNGSGFDPRLMGS